MNHLRDSLDSSEPEYTEKLRKPHEKQTVRMSNSAISQAQKMTYDKTDNNGRAFVFLEDGNLRTWEEYSASSGNGMQQNIFPKHEMSLVMPKKTIEAIEEQMKYPGGYYRNAHSNDSFNIRCYTEPGIRKAFGNNHPPPTGTVPSDESIIREKFYNYRCFDIKRWK